MDKTETVWVRNNPCYWTKNQETQWLQTVNTCWLTTQTTWLQTDSINELNDFYTKVKFYPANHC